MPKSLFGPTSSVVPSAEKSLDRVRRDVTVHQSEKLVVPATQLLEQLLPVTSKPAPVPQATNPLVDAMKDISNQVRTENNAEAYASTTSGESTRVPALALHESVRNVAALDAFGGLNAHSSAGDIHQKLAKSWEESPELTLRIIWNMRSIHEGHNNKTGFYRAFGWLYKNHPRTAIENIRFVTERLCERKIKRKPKEGNDPDGDFEIVDSEDKPTEQVVKMPHGYYKDLLNIVVLALRDELTNSNLTKFDSLNVPLTPSETRRRNKRDNKTSKASKEKQNEELGVEEAKKKREAEHQEASAARAEKAKADRRQKYEATAALLKEKLEHDKPFFALYATVAQIFADELAKDVSLLKKIEAASEAEAFELKFEISSAAKWAPTLEGFHDRTTNIGTAVALVLYARGHMADLSLSLSDGLTQQHAQTLRSYYRRWVVSPLRRFADVTEIKMAAQKWDKINYKHVPAQCMKQNKSHFFKHDEERLTNYLADVATGKSKISGATLLPHELLSEALKASPSGEFHGKLTPEQAVKMEIQKRLEESNKKVVEAQWNSIIERLRESGALESSLALVDVSGSMGSIGYIPTNQKAVEPIFPAVALGLVLAALAKPPFNNMFITFSATPELLAVPPGGLVEQAKWMVGTDWGMNTDYEAVFLKLLLPAAIKNNVKPEDMVKRLFVFSDMQFDSSLTSTTDGWETTHDRIVKAFKEAGYEAPEIVYWDLRGGVTSPVLKDTPGTALVTGFSANMMKLFMEGESLQDEPVEIGSDGEEVPKKKTDPLAVMEKALSKSCYAPLKVYD